jgi:hypothetical protein
MVRVEVALVVVALSVAGVALQNASAGNPVQLNVTVPAKPFVPVTVNA